MSTTRRPKRWHRRLWRWYAGRLSGSARVRLLVSVRDRAAGEVILVLTLVTTNLAKYQPFAGALESLRIRLEIQRQTLPELQTLSFSEAVREKARGMAELYGRPVLVDDAGLILQDYYPFPGPLTSVVLRSRSEERRVG